MHPETIGRYRIVGVLGEGGMGTVYTAVQNQPQRTVALKVIRPDFVSPELMRRFARESEVLGRLQHPGIAQIYEAGTDEGPNGPRSFFAMELVRGHSLIDYAETHRLDLSQRLELFARICDAVHYAHQQGVVHRDLKPANIMVDATGQPKVLDFGVARLTDADVQATHQTSLGEVLGTLQYMSPEQVNADPVQVDARSDVYSLGVILYQLISGRLRYDLTKKLIYEAVKVILIDDPTPLSSIDRKLAGDVEIIVARSLEKERERRYPSADELASDIRRFLRDDPIQARPASAIYHLRKFARRNRALVNGLSIAAVLLIAGTAVSVWQAVRATAAERLADSRSTAAVAASQLAERRRAVADSALGVADSARAMAQSERVAATASAERAAAETAKAQAINQFLQNMLASSDPANARGKDLSVRELLDQAGTATNSASLSSQPEVKAAVESTIGRTYFGLGLYDQARPHLDSAYAIRRRTLGARALSVAESADELGKLANASGDYAQADQRINEALTTMRTVLPRNDDRITSALGALAGVRQQQGKFADSEKLYRQALSLTRSRHGNRAVEVAAPLGSLGAFLSYTGRAAEALPLLEEAVALLRRRYGTDHPAVVRGLISLSDAQVYRPDYAAAEKTLREVLPIARTLYGNEHPTVADVLGRLGSALMNQRRLEEAEPPLREALAMRLKLLGEQHPDVQLARTELARLLQQRGAWAEAEALYNQALAARRAVLGSSSPAVAASLTDLGILAGMRDDWSSAEVSFREAAPIWKAAQIEEQELYTLAQLGWALAKQNRFDAADTVLTDVLARRQALFGSEHWSVGDSYEKLSTVALGHGKPAQAESLAARGLEIRRKVYGPTSPAVAFQLLNMAFYREVQNDTIGAIPIIREALALLASRPPSDAAVVGANRVLAIDLCAMGEAAEGESVIRATIQQVPLDSTKVMPYRVRGALGFCLMRASRFDEAETVLLQAEAGVRAVAPAAPHRDEIMRWLVSLYERWGKAEQAAAWRERLGASAAAVRRAEGAHLDAAGRSKRGLALSPPADADLRIDAASGL